MTIGDKNCGQTLPFLNAPTSSERRKISTANNLLKGIGDIFCCSWIVILARTTIDPDHLQCLLKVSQPHQFDVANFNQLTARQSLAESSQGHKGQK